MESANAAIDLNLMRFLGALIQTQSVTRSGEQLGLSQPAASRTMAKLRKVLNDPLLVRTRNGYVLTPLAQSLSIGVTSALKAASDVFSNQIFDPQKSTRTYRMATTDYGAQVVLPKLTTILETHSPHVHLLSSSWKSDTFKDLETGNVDIALYADSPIPGDFHFKDIFRETYVLIVRKDHPLLKRELKSLNQFLAEVSKYKHVVARCPNGFTEMEDDVLARLGANMSQPRFSLPYFGVAPMIIYESNLVMAIPSQLAIRYARICPIDIIPIPTQTEDFSYRLIWHERVHRDFGLQWLRKSIAEVLALP